MHETVGLIIDQSVSRWGLRLGDVLRGLVSQAHAWRHGVTDRSDHEEEICSSRAWQLCC